MKKKNIKVIQVGCGRMSKYLMRYALENGIKIIAAFDQNPNLIGEDISSVIGGEDTGIVILNINDLDESLKTEKPDCAVVATQSLLKDVAPLLSTCARYGVNVITTCDEALFPWNSSPVLTADLHKLARENNCSIMGSGFPDLSYCHMVSAVAGSAHKIHRIKGSASYNVDDYGIALAEHHGAGYSQEQFDQEIASPNRLTQVDLQELINKGEFKPIPMWNANGWLCARLDLTVIKQEQVCEPIILDVDIFSRTLNRIIPKGEVTGMRSIARTETEEGIFIETESIGKVYQEGEVDTNDWIISGEVDIHVSNSHIYNAEMICSLMAHRILDVINAPSGFITSDQLAPARYFVKPMNCYIK